MAIIFVILDGAADRGRSALESAELPNLNQIARNSYCGMWEGAKAGEGYNPKSMSDIATLGLLGYSYRDCPGRGYLEALGAGVSPRRDEIYLRGNFATIDEDFRIVDRRAGREELGLDELAEALKMRIDSVRIRVIHTVGHRCVVILRGSGLSDKVSDSDVGRDRPALIRALSTKASYTALVLNVFSDIAHELLERHPVNLKRKKKANYILLRGASKARRVKSFREKYGMSGAAIGGVAIIRGIARYLGLEFISVPGANGHVNTNLKNKVEATLAAAKRKDFVLLHINGADEASHDKDFGLKMEFLERVDREVFSKLKDVNCTLVVAIDHLTNSRTGEHEFGPTPILIYNEKIFADMGISRFCERECRRTGNVIRNPVLEALRVERRKRCS